MKGVVLAVYLFLFFSPNLSQPIKAPPQSARTARVFLLPEEGAYTFNLSAARDACLLLNATLASGDQVERALRLGLETCKFGWTADRIAVIPRLTADIKCGKGKTGVVTWPTPEDQKFGAFCFDALEERLGRSTAALQSSTYSSMLTSPLQTLVPTEPPLSSSTGPPPPRTSTVPEPASTPAFTLFSEAATSTVFTSASTSGKQFATHVPTSASHLVTSAPGLTDASSAPVQHDLSAFSESAALPSTNAPQASPGDLAMALIILASILTLLMVASIIWCYKLHFSRSWLQGQQDDCMETEMWKHTDSDVKLCNQQEEDSGRKYSSDITLGVNPQFRMTSE